MAAGDHGVQTGEEASLLVPAASHCLRSDQDAGAVSLWAVLVLFPSGSLCWDSTACWEMGGRD